MSFDYPSLGARVKSMVEYACAAHPLRMPLVLAQAMHRPPCEAIALDLVSVGSLYPGQQWIIEALQHAAALNALLDSRVQYHDADYRQRVRTQAPGHYAKLCASLQPAPSRPWARAPRTTETVCVLGGYWLCARRHKGHIDTEGNVVRNEKSRSRFHRVTVSLFSFHQPIIEEFSRRDLPTARAAAAAWVAAHPWGPYLAGMPLFSKSDGGDA